VAQSVTAVSTASLNVMSRAAIGFFILHTDILLSLDGLIEVKTTVEQLCGNLSPSAAAAITQPELTDAVADSVIEALRARARRQVNLQRRETARDRSRAHSWKHVSRALVSPQAIHKLLVLLLVQANRQFLVIARPVLIRDCW